MASTNRACTWCNQPMIGVQPTRSCDKHNICEKCTIRGAQCRSTCPCCWYDNGTALLGHFNVCSVCGQGIQSTEPPPICFRGHKHCPRCSPSACNLCKFVELRSMVNTTFENLPVEWHPIIFTCLKWEQKFEELQQANATNVPGGPQRQQSDGMETANSSVVKANTASNNCAICLEDLSTGHVTLPTCQHHFHQQCIEQWFQSSGKQTCPTCGYCYGILKGPQPSLGQMSVRYIPTALPGFPADQYTANEAPTIEITYTIPSGIQGPMNPNPGQPYTGTNRKAYLPNIPEGKYVLQLLQRAFDDQHVFTIGRSTTTGTDNVVTWNDIHHKTNIHGGPDNFGYPDPTYLSRVRRELADKGYK